MRGDPPLSEGLFVFFRVSTPHARGSTHVLIAVRTPQMVYPACAGILPRICRLVSLRLSLPRMRGDPPSCGLLVDFEG